MEFFVTPSMPMAGARIIMAPSTDSGGIGSGKGSDVVVFVSPEQFYAEIPWDGPGFDPDEVLFHELVHVSRQLRGKQTGLPVTGVGNFGNEEEYLATVITNLYLSEKGKDMRGDFDPPIPKERKVLVYCGCTMWSAVPPPKNWAVLTDPDKWYANADNVKPSPRELMQSFYNTQREFYTALSKLPDGRPKFNPVKRHFRENQKIPI